MQADLYYRHSGKFPLNSLHFGFLYGTLAGSLLGSVYAYAVLYIPIVYLNVLLAFGYGYLLGAITCRALSWLNVRNSAVFRGVTLCSTLASLYVCWAIWLHAVLSKANIHVSLWSIIRHPTAVWDLMQLINETGTWSLGRHSSAPVQGTFLWLVWIGEALIILGLAWRAASSAIFIPFCETCRHWCRGEGPATVIAEGDFSELQNRLEVKDFEYLEQVGPPQEGANTWVELEVMACKDCGATNTVTARWVKTSVDRKGRTSTTKTLLIDRLLLSADEVQRLFETANRLIAVRDARSASGDVLDENQKSDSEPVAPT